MNKYYIITNGPWTTEVYPVYFYFTKSTSFCWRHDRGWENNFESNNEKRLLDYWSKEKATFYLIPQKYVKLHNLSCNLGNTVK